MASKQVVLAVDIGSSSVRCSAYSLDEHDGEKFGNEETTVQFIEGCLASREARSVQPNSGKISVSGNGKSIMDHVDETVDDTLTSLRSTGHPFHVVAVGFSSFVMNLVGIDSEGRVLGEEASMSYACNSDASAEQCRQMRRELGEEGLQQLYQRTGAPVHSAYAIGQLRSLYAGKSRVVDKVWKWQSIAGICLSRWVGVIDLPMSYSEASWTGLLNFETCQYEASALSLLPDACHSTLPSLADFSCGSTCGLKSGIGRYVLEGEKKGKKNPYWDRWPELRGSNSNKGCRLHLGIGDGACANIGSKCSTASRIAVTVGTSAAARVCLPLPISSTGDPSSATIRPPNGLFCYRINKSHVLLGGAITDGGSVVEWVSSLLNLSTSEELDACLKQGEKLLVDCYGSSADKNPDGCHPLSFVPFLSGERSTGFRDRATGAMLGLTRETTAAHLVKSCLEGVTLRIHAILRLIQQAMNERNGEDLKPSIIASGKALEVNSLWRQMLADCSRLEVVMDDDTREGTSRGVARLVAAALNNKSAELSDELLRESNKSMPSEESLIYWARASELQENLINTLSPLFI